MSPRIAIQDTFSWQQIATVTQQGWFRYASFLQLKLYKQYH